MTKQKKDKVGTVSTNVPENSNELPDNMPNGIWVDIDWSVWGFNSHYQMMECLTDATKTIAGLEKVEANEYILKSQSIPVSEVEEKIDKYNKIKGHAEKLYKETESYHYKLEIECYDEILDDLQALIPNKEGNAD